MYKNRWEVVIVKYRSVPNWTKCPIEKRPQMDRNGEKNDRTNSRRIIKYV